MPAKNVAVYGAFFPPKENHIESDEARLSIIE